MTFSLEGKTFVIMGVANKRSIAWGVARSLHKAGAKMIFTYGKDRTEKALGNYLLHWKGSPPSFYNVM